MEELLTWFTGQSFTFLTGMFVGFFAYMVSNVYICRNTNSTPVEPSSDSNVSEYSLAEDSSYIKMVLVVRNDLKMGKGKAAAQCSHGAVMARDIAANKCPNVLKEWQKWGQRKIVVKVESESELLKLAEEAGKLGLVHATVRDAGLTQISSGTRTVLALGPGPESLIDKVTSHLRLY